MAPKVASSSKEVPVKQSAKASSKKGLVKQLPKQYFRRPRRDTTIKLYLQTLEDHTDRHDVKEFTAEWEQLIKDREFAEKKLRLNVPNVESHAEELSIKKNTEDWERIVKEREALEEHLRVSHRPVQDPRNFETAAAWRSHIQKRLGVLKFHMSIAAINIPDGSSERCPEFYYKGIDSDDWEEFQQRLEMEDSEPEEVWVYLAYPETYMDLQWEMPNWAKDYDPCQYVEFPSFPNKEGTPASKLPEISTDQRPDSPVKSSQPSSRKRPHDSSEQSTAPAKKLQIHT